MDRMAHESTHDVPQTAQKDPTCPSCQGPGKEQAQTDPACPSCQGTGRIRVPDVPQGCPGQRTPNGTYGAPREAQQV
jgi:DnaJ-class molecular chaperone